MATPQSNTDLLLASRAEDSPQAQSLFLLVYDELRALAAAWLNRERADHTLQPTALVHEAYLKLIDQTRADWKDRAHFLAVASQAIRRILVDHARAASAEKRGGHVERYTLSDTDLADNHPPPDLLNLDEALTKLAKLHPRQHDVVRLRFFGGLSGDEIAHILNIDRATVVRDWTTARAWLLTQLAESQS
ncbi:MAG TPA: ECF-type sigma factor [Phycisphaerales bacterium]|nr:ECF-type sigma factor [Phycisphaerales bacterium]